MWGQMKPARRQTTPRTPETSEGNQPSDGMCRDVSTYAFPGATGCANMREGDTHFREFFDGTLGSPGPLHDRAPMTACAPFAPDDAFAERIWRRIAGRACAAPPTPPAPPSVVLMAGERTLRPIVAKGDRRVFTLPDDTRDVRLVSPASRPGDARPWAEDRRRLGVCVRSIALDGTRA